MFLQSNTTLGEVAETKKLIKTIVHWDIGTDKTLK